MSQAIVLSQFARQQVTGEPPLPSPLDTLNSDPLCCLLPPAVDEYQCWWSEQERTEDDRREEMQYRLQTGWQAGVTARKKGRKGAREKGDKRDNVH